jgi:hypothetical protein
MHLLPWEFDLDIRAGRGAGPAGAPPQAMIQQLLNQTDQHLWALLSNGHHLRLLRDSTSLVGSAYLEFNLESIFEDELFPDFVLLFRIAHATRLQVRDQETGPASCLLEQWRKYGAEQGERALNRLRLGVEAAIEILGTGLLDHPANARLREAIGQQWSLTDFKRALFRLIYRILFWMVIEDRNALFDPAADDAIRDRYATYFSSRRLRRLAVARCHSRHGDLWHGVRLIFTVLGSEEGSSALGLPGLGGIFEHAALDEPLHLAQLTNTALLKAVEALSILAPQRGRRQPVDFRHLGADELGGLYDALLELQPRWDPAARHFHLERLAGSERKMTGSYYTPPSLVEKLLDTTLDPLLDEACALPTEIERINAIRSITVCDPACGSGHFLIAAARRIAKRLAAEETGELDPSLDAMRTALRTVASRSVHGVDVDPMAVELTKLGLWMEAIEPGKPLGFLDQNIRIGNSLLGITPKLFNDGIPDAAFVAFEGDNKKVATALRKQNAAERLGARPFDGLEPDHFSLAEEARAIAHLAPCESLADVHVQAKRAAALDERFQHRRLLADAWCTAFVGPKTERTRPYAITTSMMERLACRDQGALVDAARQTIQTMGRQYRFFHWHIEFPHIFENPNAELDPATGWRGGFSCVLGNPPWERVKLQEQEFFAARDTRIANAPNAAVRKQLIADLSIGKEPAQRSLYDSFCLASREADGVSHLLRSSGRYPLTGRGDINTYSVFAETGRALLDPCGALGMIVPTGIATDATTQDFFKDLALRKTLVALYDFENEEKIFPAVTNKFRFALLAVGGARRHSERVSLVFRVRQATQISTRAYSLTPEEITLLNPNTGTCPVFYSRRDAEIAIATYRRIPVLWRDGATDGNPWSLSFLRMFDMANDSELFSTEEQLLAQGWTLLGNAFLKGTERMLPLYEGKMTSHFDHRFSTYAGATQEQLNKGTLPRLDDAAHQAPATLSTPRYWISEKVVEARLGSQWDREWFLGWRDIAVSVNERTLVASIIPRVAAGHTYPIAMTAEPASHATGLLANLSAFCLDYIVRQKTSSSHMTYTYLKQIPVLPPATYADVAAWDGEKVLLSWIAPRTLELCYTAHDLAGFANDLGDHGPPFRWDPVRREMMRAELDAAYFHLYGINRDDVAYIMDTFKVVREKDEKSHGEYRTKRLILERYDALADATRTGRPYRSPLDPPGRGRRHPD